MFVIGYSTKDDTIIEHLTNFDGTTMMFKTRYEAEDYDMGSYQCLCNICFDHLNSEGKITWKEKKDA